MEMTEWGGAEPQTTTTAIRGVQRRAFVKGGRAFETVTVQTDDGDFSNFMNVWEAQEVDLARLDPGDEIEVVWQASERGGREYRNFLRVRPTGLKGRRSR